MLDSTIFDAKPKQQFKYLEAGLNKAMYFSIA